MQMAEETIKVGMREFPPQVSDRSLSIPKLPVSDLRRNIQIISLINPNLSLF